MDLSHMKSGSWDPPDCIARQRIAVIIPAKNREEHLHILLQHLHPFLQSQRVAYSVYVVDQVLHLSVHINRRKIFRWKKRNYQKCNVGSVKLPNVYTTLTMWNTQHCTHECKVCMKEKKVNIHALQKRKRKCEHFTKVNIPSVRDWQCQQFENSPKTFSEKARA